jgi:hypothetical protein
MTGRAAEEKDKPMKQFTHKLACAAWVIAALASGTASAATLHVWQDSPNPVPPYDSWGNAATNIQDAVDAADPGDTVLVTNGVFATGGRAVVGMMTNRVAVDRAVTVQSVNGPEVTVIAGAPAPGGRNGGGAIRCVYLDTNAVLSGFTLTNGYTRSWSSAEPQYTQRRGGGAWCEISATLTNCIIIGNSAYDWAGGVQNGTLYDCTLTGNSTYYGGGGARGSALTNCIINNNSGGEGGGTYGSTLYNCTLTGNSSGDGGGACACTLYHCTLTDNTAWGWSEEGGAIYAGEGGGAYSCTLYNCLLSGNAVSSTIVGAFDGDGGGSADSILYNCILTNNRAHRGGGTYGDMLFNCTVTGNSGDIGGGAGGGAFGSILQNCIVYFNSAPSGPNYSGTTFNSSCTTPMPTNGVGNIDLDPLFIDTNGWSNLRLQSNSPCINAGNNAYITDPADLDGNPRIVRGTVDMGAYEFQSSGSLISYAWLLQFGLPTDGSADTTDLDGDLMNTWQEWVADTNPTNALSYFHIDSISKGSPPMISFQSSCNRSYTLWSTPQVASPDWVPVPGEQAIPGNGGTLTLSDPSNAPQRFYRVQVNLP